MKIRQIILKHYQGPILSYKHFILPFLLMASYICMGQGPKRQAFIGVGIFSVPYDFQNIMGVSLTGGLFFDTIGKIDIGALCEAKYFRENIPYAEPDIESIKGVICIVLSRNIITTSGGAFGINLKPIGFFATPLLKGTYEGGPLSGSARRSQFLLNGLYVGGGPYFALANTDLNVSLDFDVFRTITLNLTYNL